MPGTTPVYGFPYPELTDLVADYPALGQQLAEDVEDIIAALARASTAEVTTSQTTTSTSYTDLATAGPTVTVTTGTKALVVVSGYMFNNTGNQAALMSVAISGASTFAAADNWAVEVFGATGSAVAAGASRATLFTGLTAGSNTFTSKYKVTGGTGTFRNRGIIVLNMGS